MGCFGTATPTPQYIEMSMQGIATAGSLRNGIAPQVAAAPGLQHADAADPTSLGSTQCRLYRIPEQLCREHREEHVPSYVSIGPYHYQEGLPKVRSNAWKDYCVRIVESLLPPSQHEHEHTLLDAMATIEEQVKLYYDDLDLWSSFSFSNNGQAFREMLMRDGCFLLVTLGVLAQEPELDIDLGEEAVGADGPLPVMTTHSKWDHQFWFDDIVLSGNQLPFAVVQEIYRLIRPGTDRQVPLQNIGMFIQPKLAPRYTRRPVSNPVNADHVLHLCHELLKPTVTTVSPRASEASYTDDRQEDGGVGRWRRATEYSSLMVTFRERDLVGGDAQCVTDVRVRGDRVVEIPKLELDLPTWRLLRHLMLLEQMNEHLGDHVTAYCTFMSQIASTSADVSLLREKGILEHWEASDERAAQKLGKLCDQMHFNPDEGNYLEAEWRALDRHCRRSRSRLWAKLCRYKDWKNPLVLLGILVAIVILVCAILQTIYAISSYDRDKMTQPSRLHIP